MTRDQQIVKLYKEGKPATYLGELFNITPRQIQRIVKRSGASRTISESYILAIQQGRMKYLIKPKSELKRRLKHRLRYQVLKRDDFRCVYCGRTAKDCHRLEVDHIDENPANNLLENLQTLCDDCNKGKSYEARSIG